MSLVLRLLVAVALAGVFGAAASASNNLPQSPLTFLLNSGWAWAAVPVWAGALQLSKLTAALAGPLAGAAAVFAYYLSDSAFGRTPLGDSWYDIGIWLVGYAVIGSAFGLIGYAARSNRFIGLLAGVFVPLGAFLEMVYLPRWPAVDAVPDLQLAQVIVWVAAPAVILGLAFRYVSARRTRRLSDPTGVASRTPPPVASA